MDGSLPVASQALTIALCVVVWLLMAALPLAIYRLRYRSLQRWISLLLLNAALWGVWIWQYRLIASNPPWATRDTRFWLLLIESVGSVIILFSMMYRERNRKREEHLKRLDRDG